MAITSSLYRGILFNVTLAVLLLAPATAAWPCGAKHMSRLEERVECTKQQILVMTSRLAVSLPPGESVPLLALAGTIFERGDRPGENIQGCIASGACTKGPDGSCIATPAPVDLAERGQISFADACLGARLVQPTCRSGGQICRNNKDCSGQNNVCECPTGSSAPASFAVKSDPREADGEIEPGNNVLCFQCEISLSGAGLSNGDKFNVTAFVNTAGGRGKKCDPNTCDGDGDGANNPAVSTATLGGADVVPAP